MLMKKSIFKPGLHTLVLLTAYILTVPLASAQPQMTISDLVTALRLIGSALFGLALLWGAARIMASAGDPRLMEEGKNIVKNAVIGYVVIMLASLVPSLSPGGIEPLVIIPP